MHASTPVDVHVRRIWLMTFAMSAIRDSIRTPRHARIAWTHDCE
jgi:hypothetical protein